MSKLHIISIGGTGHKLISACVYLTACGAFKGKLGSSEINSIRAITIDADDSHGALSETKQVIGAYNKFYKALGPSKTLDLVEIEPLSQVRLYQEDKKSIREAFNIAQYNGQDTDKFIRFLYTNKEIDEQFDQGFYGHTSIGTLIVQEILVHDEKWSSFLNGINGNDYVFIVGSIFGGTGASAIPVVLDSLKKIKNENANVKYAVLLLTPYFNTVGDIKEEGELKPDSVNFHLKAKAALYYYYKQKKYEDADAVYVIGEPKENFSNEAASRGSANQKNKAHPVELFAATAMIDFIKNSDDRLDKKIITAERKKGDGEYYWTWDMVQNIDSNLPLKIQKFMKLCVFYNKVLYGDIIREASGSWTKNYDRELLTEMDEGEKGNFIYENVHKFTEKFVSWVYDLHKRNSTERDQATGGMKWIPDNRLELFNASYGNLFDNRDISGSKIDNFKFLVYNDTNSKKSEKIYAEICEKKPRTGGAKRFPELFDTLGDLISQREFKLFSSGKKKPETGESVPYLSQENEVTFIRPKAASGHLWSKSEPTLLTDIADGLPFVLSDEFSINDVAIPSPWSIFITNELTLTEDKFASLNRFSYNQWCGLIALLVLKKLCLYEKDGLKLESLTLDTTGEFVETVRATCLPYSYIFDNPDWTNCYHITLDGETIAFLALNTIICPAYYISPAAKMKLHKMAPSIVDDRGEFLSPNNYFSDSSQSTDRNAKYALRLFLDELEIIITNEAAGNRKPIVNALQRLVDKFINDLGNTTFNPNISLATGGGEIRTVCDIFEKRYIRSSVEQEKPFLLAGVNRAAALIGLNICGISSSSPQATRIHITDNLLYSQIDAINVNEMSGKEEGDSGILLLYDNTMLLDSMVVINKNDTPAFHSRSNKTSLQDYEVIWPVSEDILNLYDVEKLNNMLSIQRDSDTLTVSLELKLASGKTHTVKKEYKLQTDMSEDDISGKCFIFDKRQLPFWAVWPYCEILDMNGVNTWKRYNFFCVTIKQRGATRVLEAEPVFTGNLPVKEESKLSTISDANRDKYYKRFTALPTGLKLKIKSNADIASEYCGVVLLNPPIQYTASDVVWNIGLDFGTTSTTAFYTTNTENVDPAFLRLLSEYGWTEGNSNPEIRNKIFIDMCVLSNSGDVGEEDFKLYFIDDKCLEQNSWITTYEVMDKTNLSAEDTVFKMGRIFWHNYDNFKVMNAQEGRRDNLRTNIKWDVDNRFVGKYLNQLLTQTAYTAAKKGVRSINWYFSYPTAFGRGAKGEFASKLKTLLENLIKDTGIQINFDKEKNMVTESIAAAFYFRKKHTLERVFLCVDIGGGTSDVSIWTKEENLFQTSIRFASRDMFVSPLSDILYNNPSILAAVRTNKKEDGIYTMLEYGGPKSGISLDMIHFLIETVLFEYYDTVRNRLNQLGGNDQKFYKNFKYSVFIAYSGLLYYLGNIIIALLKSGGQHKKIDNDTAVIVFGLSGKGSKLTNWIDSFCPIIYEGVENMIAEKTGIAIEFQVEFDEKYAKTETAKGLICNLDAAGNQRESAKLTEPEVFLGSGITLYKNSEPKIYSKDDFIRRYEDEYIEDTRLLRPDIDKDLADFGEYLEFFNQLAGKTQGEMPKIDMDWYKSKKNHLWNLIKTSFETILKEDRFDPPFIAILKVFLEVYNKEYLHEKK